VIAGEERCTTSFSPVGGPAILAEFYHKNGNQANERSSFRQLISDQSN
jgi:hypothetical protein